MVRLYRFIRSIYSNLIILHLNFRLTRHMSPIPTEQWGEYIFSGLQKKRVSEVLNLYAKLKNGRKMSVWRSILLKYRGPVICSVVLNDQKIIGFSLHYFRDSEYKNGIIHLGFSGVTPQQRGKGLMSSLRRFTVRHYASQELKGISAKIDADNIASYRAAAYGGFKVVKKPSTQGEPYEIFWDFSDLK